MTKIAYLATSAAALVMATSAMAADLPYRRAAPAPMEAYPPAFTTSSWTGGYVGGSIGWRSTSFDPVMNSMEIAGKSRNTATFGGFAGYNFQVSPNIVLGVEGDMNYGKTNAHGPAVVSGPGMLSSRYSLDWAGSARGRIGYTQDSWMIYGTGGLAFADLKMQGTYTTPGAFWTTTDSKWAAGYAVGAGLEYMLTQNLTLRGEYLYSDFGRHSVSIPNGGQASVEVDSHTARAGVAYKF